MRKWEYKIISEPNYNEFEVSMCEAGSAGWAFAAMLPNPSGIGATALMKRSLQTMIPVPAADD